MTAIATASAAETAAVTASQAPLLVVEDLKVYFPINGGLFGRVTAQVHAVDGVSLTIGRGETLSIVGESGCGKSTLGRAVLRLIRPTSGAVWLDGCRIDRLPERQLRPMRRRMQMVFQDPFSSLNPRMRVRDIIAEPLRNFGLASPGRAALEQQVAALLDQVQAPREWMRRFPHELSGGQRQRIGLARALAPGAELIVCDEAVGALDGAVKAQMINLLSDLQDQLGLALLFISHDLGVVAHLTHRVAVMYLGKIVEIADRATVFGQAHHPYTRALLSTMPVLDPTPAAKDRRIVLGGEIPSPIDPPAGCRFHTRCRHVFDRCRTETPRLRAIDGRIEHLSACHLPPTTASAEA